MVAQFGWGNFRGLAVLRYPKNMARFPKVPSSSLPDETGEMAFGKTHHWAIHLWVEGHWHRQTEVHNEEAWKRVLNLYKGIHTRTYP